MNKDQAGKIWALFAAGLILFNFPVIGLFGSSRLPGDLPAILVFFFGCWLWWIVVLWRLNRKSKQE